AAIEEMFAEAGSHLTQETDARSPAQALAVYIDFYLSPAHRDARATGCPMPSLAADLPRLTEKARQRFSAGVVGLRRRVADWLARAGHGGPEEKGPPML